MLVQRGLKIVKHLSVKTLIGFWSFLGQSKFGVCHFSRCKSRRGG